MAIGAVALLVAVALMYVAFKAPTGIPLKPYYDVSAQFKSLGTLDTGADVTISGRLVGQVVNPRLVNGVPTVDLQLNSSTPQLPIDTTARIRPRGLLGAEYIDLTPGRSKQTLPNGGLIPAADNSASEQLSDLLATFNAPTRRGFGEVIQGLGEGLMGRGPELNQALATLPSTLRNLSHALTPLLARTNATANLIAGANSLVAAFDPVRQYFMPGFDAGTEGLRPFAEERASIARLLDVAPSSLTQIQGSLDTTDTVLQHLTTFADQATHFTALAPTALHSLTAVLVRGRQPLSDATALLKTVQPAIHPILGLTAALDPELAHLQRLLTEAEPALTTVSPYDCDFAGFTHNWRGFLGLGAKLQSGLLGPNTMLRTELGSPFAQVGQLSLIPPTQDVTPAPCVPGGGP
jgi:phospholipid/cholesterol/gamma-HCH transport system substrate-binding protein